MQIGTIGAAPRFKALGFTSRIGGLWAVGQRCTADRSDASSDQQANERRSEGSPGGAVATCCARASSVFEDTATGGTSAFPDQRSASTGTGTEGCTQLNAYRMRPVRSASTIPRLLGVGDEPGWQVFRIHNCFVSRPPISTCRALKATADMSLAFVTLDHTSGSLFSAVRAVSRIGELHHPMRSASVGSCSQALSIHCAATNAPETG